MPKGAFGKLFDEVEGTGRATGAEDVLQLLFGQLLGDGLTGQLRISEQLVEAALQLAHIAADGASQEFDHLFADLHILMAPGRKSIAYQYMFVFPGESEPIPEDGGERGEKA